MREILKLCFQEIAPGRVYHAALVTSQKSRSQNIAYHTHDFLEIFYVLEGVGTHEINGCQAALHAHDLWLIRAEDIHAIRTREKLYFINIAFSLQAWQAFSSAADLEQADLFASISVPTAQRTECARIFHATLGAYHQNHSAIDLCRFFSIVLPLLLPKRIPESIPPKTTPLWLTQSCHAMETEENLLAGLPRFIALSGVSLTHLARMLKLYCAQTPTEFINQLRLRRAATLLATTSGEIIDIAYDCGFENLSYFYRLFRRYYGRTPRAFRLDTRRAVAP